MEEVKPQAWPTAQIEDASRLEVGEPFSESPPFGEFGDVVRLQPPMSARWLVRVVAMTPYEAVLVPGRVACAHCLSDALLGGTSQVEHGHAGPAVAAHHAAPCRVSC